MLPHGERNPTLKQKEKKEEIERVWRLERNREGHC